jgi:hypothetical protein
MTDLLGFAVVPLAAALLLHMGNPRLIDRWLLKGVTIYAFLVVLAAVGAHAFSSSITKPEALGLVPLLLLPTAGTLIGIRFSRDSLWLSLLFGALGWLVGSAFVFTSWVVLGLGP